MVVGKLNFRHSYVSVMTVANWVGDIFPNYANDKVIVV